MSWIHKDSRTWLQKLITPIIQVGGVPKHIALIMDGNRRFAKDRGLPASEGHQRGYIKMDEVFSWCSTLGVKEVTIYAFSIENFKRSPQEVANIMRFILSRISLMLQKLDQAVCDGTCIQFPGDWSMVPEYMKPTMAKLIQDTRHGRRFRINIALAYTGRNDIARGVELVRGGINNKLLNLQDISEYCIQEAWQLIPGLPVDILIRTSGETRLSDFVMWEASHAYLDFVNVQWPQFSYDDLIRSILAYQVHRKSVHVPPVVRDRSEGCEARVEKFLKHVRQKSWGEIMLEARRAP